MKKPTLILFLVLYSFQFNLCIAQSGIINTITGNGVAGFSGDGGIATAAEINYNSGIALDDSGNIYIADALNSRVRKVTASTGIINTIAGGGIGGNGGQATSAGLNSPLSVAVDKLGNFFIADWGNNLIWKVTASTGIITIIAGNGYIHRMVGLPPTWGGYSGNGGQATDAEMNGPEGVVLDDSNNIYIADSYNNVIRKVTISTGIITNAAGNAFHASMYGYASGYSGNGGPATNAELYYPSDMSFDDTGNMYIADQYNNMIRKVNVSTGVIDRVVGIHTGGYSGDGGTAIAAELNQPASVSLDKSDNMYITDAGNSLIRMVTESTGIISTIAGNYSYGHGYSGDGGPATAAELYFPQDNAIDTLGNLYISDGNNVIRKVTYDTTTVTRVTKLITENVGLSVFPNPNNGNFVLSLTNSNEKYSLEIYNILGARIYSESLPQSQDDNINLTGQPNGVYLYRVTKETGNLIGSGKLIIEK